ncbi:MAG: c-type cytochrome [Alphaproteobacteria bacterium]|nr:c-type cytochrome [Alphaproteobacteria bacterium]
MMVTSTFGVVGLIRAEDGNGSRPRADLSAADDRRVRKVTAPATDFSRPEQYEASQGGAGTSRQLISANAFSHSAANIGFADEERFKLGNALFRKFWVSSPSSTQASDGLGPLFNARACQSCHLRDGRGHPPEGSSDATSMLIRLARAPRTQTERAALDERQMLNLPDPVYGGQIQDKAVPGLQSEGQIDIRYQEIPVALPGGGQATLRRPTYTIIELAHGPLAADTTLSPRIAPPMIGLGLIEAIHPEDIAAEADPDDLDGDGISGRISLVRDRSTGDLVQGRFGWKASQPSLRAQNAAAFSGDIGISTSEFPSPNGDCTAVQIACLGMPTGVQQRLGSAEAPDPVLDLVTFYTANLAVPERRDVGNPAVLRGKQLFYESGCTACHTPKFVTRRDAEHPEHAFQLIWPYSDFLLHDMGPGLADGQKVGDASGREWRTPPLWGIGLTQTVNGHTFFLHDGRARNLSEAILWHGGEAKAARDRFLKLPETDKSALISFLSSL